MIIDAARRLEAAECQLLLTCTNTMHQLTPKVEAGTMF